MADQARAEARCAARRLPAVQRIAASLLAALVAALAALWWLGGQLVGARRVGVIGFSLGGAAALLGPRGPLGVDALVFLAAILRPPRAL